MIQDRRKSKDDRNLENEGRCRAALEIHDAVMLRGMMKGPGRVDEQGEWGSVAPIPALVVKETDGDGES